MRNILFLFLIGCGAMSERPLVALQPQGADAYGATADVACGSRTCDLAAGEVCCVDPYELPKEWPCSTSCPSPNQARHCDGPEDCDGRPCCRNPSWGSACLAETASECEGARLCHDASDCPSGQSCTDSTCVAVLRRCG
jgi:hypothetical protein